MRVIFKVPEFVYLHEQKVPQICCWDVKTQSWMEGLVTDVR